MTRVLTRAMTCLAATALAASLAPPARAADDDVRLKLLERQIAAMQAELRAVKADMAAHARAEKATLAEISRAQAHAQTQAILTAPPAGYALVATANGNVLEQILPPAPPEKPLPPGTWQLGGVRVTLGGFIEAAGIYRSRNSVADISSNFNTGIPLPNSPLYHENQFGQSIRQSRFAGLAQGKPDSDTTLTAFFEGDLQSSPPTANANESNGYTLRVRHAFATYDRSDLGFYVLGGQTWSLLTMSKSGIPYLGNGASTPAATPPGVDGQYVPGFVWTRNVQLRAVQSLADGMVHLGLSLEQPQTLYYAGPNGAAPASAGTVNNANAGGSGFASTVNYTTEVAPDVIAKVTLDPGWGHFEAFGVARFEHDRDSFAAGTISPKSAATGFSHTTDAGGGGAAAYVPLVPGLLDFQASILAGKGIGRYGSSQLPDAITGPTGKPEPLSEYEALAGLIGHVTPALDVYGFAGTEQERPESYNVKVKGKLVPYGYGNVLYPNTSCDAELGSSSSCIANTSGVVQGTAGAWWKFLHGSYGTMQVGPQYSYTRRTIFQGTGRTPRTDENTLLLSFRYYPFQ